MIDKPPTTVNVPESEVARQATDALGGYAYQLDQTVMTWLALDEDEALHVEFAEDMAVSGDGRLNLTQVKRVRANITLRSDGVAKLITAVWEFQKKNPSRRVTGALLTTSGIGKEKEISFPGEVPGLVYWRTAARDGASSLANPAHRIPIAIALAATARDSFATFRGGTRRAIPMRISPKRSPCGCDRARAGVRATRGGPSRWPSSRTSTR